MILKENMHSCCIYVVRPAPAGRVAGGAGAPRGGHVRGPGRGRQLVTAIMNRGTGLSAALQLGEIKLWRHSSISVALHPMQLQWDCSPIDHVAQRQGGHRGGVVAVVGTRVLVPLVMLVLVLRLGLGSLLCVQLTQGALGTLIRVNRMTSLTMSFKTQDVFHCAL